MKETIAYPRLTQLIRQRGYLFLDTEDGEIWVLNAPPKTLVQLVNHLTFPHLASILKSRTIQSTTLTLLTIVDKHDILGLAILQAHTPTHCEILSLRIPSTLRRQGYGTFLLNQVELLCLKSNITLMSLHYRTYWKSATYWEKVLQKKGWQESKTLMFYLIRPVDLWDKVFQASWFVESPLPPTIEIKEATPSHLKELHHYLETHQLLETVPNTLHPLQMSEQLQADASIIAYQNDQLVGWCFVHFLRDDIWQCTTLYLLPAFRSAQLGKVLTAEMSRRFAARGNLHYLIEPQNEIMLNFAKKHYVPAGAILARLVQMQKKLE